MAEDKIFITPDPDLVEEAAWYKGQLETHLLNARKALSQDEISTLETIGHRLKGSAESFGFTLAGEIGRNLEAASKSKDSKGISTSIDALADYVDRIEIV